jgi:superfamily II DNA/RNA helicase
MPDKASRQTFLFSATFPDEIQALAREFLRDYTWIGIEILFLNLDMYLSTTLYSCGCLNALACFEL